MKKIKVAVVIPTHANLRSSLHVLVEIYRHLEKTRNIKATIFTDSKNSFDYGIGTVKVKGLDYNTFFSKILFFLGLPRHFYIGLIGKLKGYDVIETSNPEFYVFAYQGYLAARKYNAKLILRTSQTIDGFFLFRLTKHLFIPIAKKAYDFASWLFFTNPEAAERAVRLGLMQKNSGKVVITGHAVDTSVFKPLKIKKPKKPIILSVGGLYKIKGHHLIIEALSKVREDIDAELWIAGEGYYKKRLEQLAEKFGISGNVKFLGSKPKKELAEIYNKSSVFVLANYQEITPAVNEALACNVPVVVMECGGRKLVIPNEDYGLIANRFDAEDMAGKISALIEDKGLARKIAKKGRNHIMKNFSLKKVADKFYRAFVK